MFVKIVNISVITCDIFSVLTILKIKTGNLELIIVMAGMDSMPNLCQ
jgi:hypothetical protein